MEGGNENLHLKIDLYLLIVTINKVLIIIKTTSRNFNTIWTLIFLYIVIQYLYFAVLNLFLNWFYGHYHHFSRQKIPRSFLSCSWSILFIVKLLLKVVLTYPLHLHIRTGFIFSSII